MLTHPEHLSSTGSEHKKVLKKSISLFSILFSYLYLPTLSLNTKSDRKFELTYGQWQIKLWTSAKQTSLTVKSEKSSFLRKMLSKIWNFKIKNIWPPKNIWRTLGDVKSNFGQLLFSTSSWFFHSLRSYWALKFSKNIWTKIFWPQNIDFLKLNNSSGSQKINLV